jgi:HSP20 family protein
MTLRSKMPDIRRGEYGLWAPFKEMNRLQRRLDHMFEDFFPWSMTMSPESAEFTPACDVDETESHYLVTFDLPGLKKEDVKIDLRDNQLTISGERKGEMKGRVSSERYYGSFCRSFVLPPNINSEKVEANYENGVLQVALPKTAVSVGKEIPIKEGKVIEVKTGKAA